MQAEIASPRSSASSASRTAPFAAACAGLAAAMLLGGCVVAPAGYPHQRAYERPPPPPAATAEPLYFYPQRGQPQSLQERDRYECYRWAVQESGTDPGMTPVYQVPTARLPPQPPPGADVVAGAATGAVLGAAVSSPRRTGEAAVIGAIFGAVVGAAAQESRQRAVEQAQARQAEAASRARVPQDNFRRAMTACMRGRGYHVE